MIDPRARQRQQTVLVRPSVRPDLSNGDLMAMWQQAWEGKMGKGVMEGYARSVRDAVRYFRAEEKEIPVREWTKEGVRG